MIDAKFFVSRADHFEPVERGVFALAALPNVGEVITLAGDEFQVRRRHFFTVGDSAEPPVHLYLLRLRS